MRIATLQFAPKLGDVEGNVRRANEILARGKVLSSGLEALVNSKLGIDTTSSIERLKPDVLVLPEMALSGMYQVLGTCELYPLPSLRISFVKYVCLFMTGYNFPSLEAIKPFLEPAGKGRSAEWARDTAQRLNCKVCIGYPEIEISGENETETEKYYNSLLVVDEHGEVLHNYRKCFLYFTDDTWASEGNVERGFHELEFRSQDDAATDLVGDIRRDGSADAVASASEGGDNPVRATATATKKEEAGSTHKVATSFGICMDINPYKFEAPYSAYEFASRILDSRSQLVIVSMAWLTTHSREALDALNKKPDMDTFSYWLQRLMPLMEKEMQHARNVDENDAESPSTQKQPKQVVIVFANRAGEEPAADDTKPPALYAGTSTVVAVTQRAGSESREGAQAENQMEAKILCWDQLGAQEEGICFADTTADPKMVFGLRRAE